jgi:hypothetical protein
MCAIDNCEPWAVVSTWERKARKAYYCTECARMIRQREAYTHVKGKTEDDPGWSEFRICRHCKAAGAWLQIVCGGYPLTMLIDELDEHAREYPASELLPELLISIRDRWNDGQAPIPPIADLEADAWRCLGKLVRP